MILILSKYGKYHSYNTDFLYLFLLVSRFKLLKWWAQSFLLGIPKIIGGFRDDEGIVRRLEVFKTLEIPKMLRVSFTNVSLLIRSQDLYFRDRGI